MRAAQSIEVQLGSGRREAAALAGLWLFAVATAASWLAARDDWPAGVRVAAFLVLAVGGAAAGWGSRPMHGVLAWDGQAWLWRAPAGGETIPAPGLRTAIDAGGWMLLRDDAGRWCGIARGEAAERWHGLRLALHAGRPGPRRGATP